MSFDLHSKERIDEALAADLVQMHKDTGIELEYWEIARMFIEQFYEVETSVKIVRKYTAEERANKRKRGY